MEIGVWWSAASGLPGNHDVLEATELRSFSTAHQPRDQTTLRRTRATKDTMSNDFAYDERRLPRDE